MLKKRIVGCLTLKDTVVVQSIGFKRYLPVGSLRVSVEALNQWGITEIAILDMDATERGAGPNLELIKQATEKCFTPLAVGGGVRSIDDMRALNHLGVEKVIINTLAFKRPKAITEAAKIFGSQFVVVSIDVKRVGDGYEVYADGGKHPTGLDPVAWAQQVEQLGVGEIFLNSIDRDGSKQGFDLDVINQVNRAVRIPLIACGGAGRAHDFYEVMKKTNVAAVAAGNFFHFTEHSPIVLKSFLRSRRMPIRIETYAKYHGARFDERGRLAKRPERYLDKLRFIYLPDETI